MGLPLLDSPEPEDVEGGEDGEGDDEPEGPPDVLLGEGHHDVHGEDADDEVGEHDGEGDDHEFFHELIQIVIDHRSPSVHETA